MSVPRLLVIEGNTAEARARQASLGTRPYAESYVDVLRSLQPEVTPDIIRPADEGVALPDIGALSLYDGVVLTGSWLNIYEGGGPIERQIELIRRVFASGTPLFGSCWGLQVATVAAGGKVRRNPKGREIGIATPIQRTTAGKSHPMLAGKPDPYVAITVHLDEVEVPAPGSTVLAGNDWSTVQAAEIRHGNGVAWAVQYHPEFSFTDIAAVTRRYGPDLVKSGRYASEHEVEHLAEQLQRCENRTLDPGAGIALGVDDSVLNAPLRRRELANWFEHLVFPAMRERGRS